MSTTRPHARTLVAIAIALASSNALAQWRVVRLGPPNSTHSTTNSIGPRLVGGSANFNGTTHAVAWLDFTADSWVDLHPLGFQSSMVTGVVPGQQVGNALVGDGHAHAGYWTGTAASWVDLNPTGAPSAWVNCTNGTTQGGYAQLHGGGDRAVLWFGSRDSVLDMSPKGYIGGSITGLAGNMQVGHGQTSQTSHAGLWRGTPDSFVDLHPQEATWSEASATDGHQQVGVGIALTDNAYLWQALLWNGTAESCVFLRPQGATNSFASGVWGGFQVGSAEFNRKATASIWNGTPESWFDLGQFAPKEYDQTGAHSIWADEHFMYVAGTGWNNATNTAEALLWSRPIPAPSALPLCIAVAAISHRRRRPIP